MSLYKPISVGWPDNPKVRLLTREEVKRLVNTDQWAKLGEVFGFTPVYHLGFTRMIDWRCVPQSLLDYLKQKETKKQPPPFGVKCNRVQERKYIRSLMLAGEWERLKAEYNFTPRFYAGVNGRKVFDWTCIPWNIRNILKCGSGIKETPFKEEGGIYDPLEKPKKPKRGTVPQSELVPRKSRVSGLKLVERIPVRFRLYEAQEGRCHYCNTFIMCGSREWTIDHKLPISRGGTNEDANLVGACEDCNTGKGALTEEEFLKSDFLIYKLAQKESSLKP